jgi:hypothetical protein
VNRLLATATYYRAETEFAAKKLIVVIVSMTRDDKWWKNRRELIIYMEKDYLN